MANIRIHEPLAAGRAIIVLTTWPADRNPDELARPLIEQHLAACVNVLPIMHSHYWWNGAAQCEGERQIVMKTTAERLAALHAALERLHPYEVPEFLVLDVAAGADTYLDWVGTAAAQG